MKRRPLIWGILIALLPLAAWAGMTAITDQDLSEVQGQTGITVNASVTMSAGDVGWEDAGGFTGAASNGTVILSGVTMPSVSLSGVIIDAGSTATTSYLQLDTGTTNLITGNFVISKLIIGRTLTSTLANLGKFQISNTAVSLGKIKISGH